ncbi:XRE family transcriptional regulator [Leuconostoc citreum]|uniref:helix-turn-helix domain-containing protein n=1 Tax=Leuconostoc citreum TaxID=33964 RepID=UPI0021A7FCD0|nr:helix-turn-helix transcriptional regulator [Leuconostoc citreum]MCT3075309.1 XRE family transcriptional regulator [Leuconostoc citreum]
MSLFERIKTTAKSKGMSILELEKKVGMSENSLYTWKKSSPKSENLSKVADVLHVSVDYLLERTDDPSTKSNDKPKYVDLTDDDIIMAFNGKPISDKYRRAIKAFLEEDDD